MKLRSRLAALAVVTVTAGLLPLAGTASAGDCDSNIQIFFYTGARVADEDVTNGIALDSPVLGCIVGEEAGLDVDIFYVLPGATFAAGRDNGAVCKDTPGHIFGLGTDSYGTWTKDSDCGELTDVSTGGASSPLYPIDPTQQGVITAETSNGSIQYRTIDR